MYWDSIEDNLMQVYFNTGSTKLQKAKAINAVMPKLKMMARIILERYFVRFTMPELVDDAVMHVLQYSKFNPEKSNTYYAYLGTSMKRFFHTKLIVEKSYNGLKFDDTEDINDNQYVMATACEAPEFDEFDYDERQLLLNKIIVRLDDGISKAQKMIRKYNKRKVVPFKPLETLNRSIALLTTAKEYFNKYFLVGGVNSMGLADYCRNNCGEVPLHVQRKLLQQYFGIGSAIDRFDDRDSLKEKNWKSQGRTYIQDDYCPNKSKMQQIKKNFNIRNRKINTSDYEYF